MSLSSIRSVGFVGVGAMGKPMVGHLAEKLPADTSINIFDVSEEMMEQAVSAHPGRMSRCASAKEVADNSEVIFSMVPEGSHVKAAYLNAESGICTSDIDGKLLIDCSTIDTATSLTVKDHIKQKFPKASFYDAPVSGGVVGATNGTIAFFLGCREDDPNLSRVTELLELMGGKVIPCGGPSLGLAAKLSNNYLSGIIAIACSEALDMGMRTGLDPRVLASVFSAGTAQNTICDKFCPCPGISSNEAPSNKGYRGGFKIQLMRKDFALAMQMAQTAGCNNVLGEVGLDTYTKAMNDPRCKDLDSRVVYRYLGCQEDWEEKQNSEKSV